MFKEGLDGEYWKLHSDKRQRKSIFQLPGNNSQQQTKCTITPIIPKTTRLKSTKTPEKLLITKLKKIQKTTTSRKKNSLNGITFESTKIIIPIINFTESHPSLLEEIHNNSILIDNDDKKEDKNNNEESLYLPKLQIQNENITNNIIIDQNKNSKENKIIKRKTPIKRNNNISKKQKTYSKKIKTIIEPIPKEILFTIPIQQGPEQQKQHHHRHHHHDNSIGNKVFQDSNIWVGGKSCLENFEWLVKENVKSFVNVTNEVAIPYCLNNDNYRTLRIRISDSESEPINKYFQESIEFIQESFEKYPNSSVLIHCKEGRSRSTTLAIVYGMKVLSMSLKESYERVAKACPRININIGFLYQLMSFEKSLSNDGKNSIDFFSRRSCSLRS